MSAWDQVIYLYLHDWRYQVLLGTLFIGVLGKLIAVAMYFFYPYPSIAIAICIFALATLYFCIGFGTFLAWRNYEPKFLRLRMEAEELRKEIKKEATKQARKTSSVNNPEDYRILERPSRTEYKNYRAHRKYV
jgi:hypothetical protein